MAGIKIRSAQSFLCDKARRLTAIFSLIQSPSPNKLKENNTMLNKTLIFILTVVVCLAMLNSSTVSSISVIPQLSSDSETPEVVRGKTRFDLLLINFPQEPFLFCYSNPETSLIAGKSDGQVSSRHEGRVRSDFSFWDLFPTYFGEYFEIFVFFMELKWHYEIEDAIAEASERIDEHLVNGDRIKHKNDNFLLDFAKHYFVNNTKPLWKFKA
jgi:hypothetical protein